MSYNRSCVKAYIFTFQNCTVRDSDLLFDLFAVIIRGRAVAVDEAHLTSFTARLLTISSVMWGGGALSSLSWRYTAKGIAHLYFTFMSLCHVRSYIKKGPNDADGRVIWVR